MKDEYIYNKITPKCSTCDEPATTWWPAYDPKRDPDAFCNKCLEAEKKLYTPNPPKFTQMMPLDSERL